MPLHLILGEKNVLVVMRFHEAGKAATPPGGTLSGPPLNIQGDKAWENSLSATGVTSIS